MQFVLLSLVLILASYPQTSFQGAELRVLVPAFLTAYPQRRPPFCCCYLPHLHPWPCFPRPDPDWPLEMGTGVGSRGQDGRGPNPHSLVTRIRFCCVSLTKSHHRSGFLSRKLTAFLSTNSAFYILFSTCRPLVSLEPRSSKPVRYDHPYLQKPKLREGREAPGSLSR